MNKKETTRRVVAETALILTAVEVCLMAIVVPEWKLCASVAIIPFVVYGLFLVLWKLE